MSTATYNLDRKTAARMLGISLRTLDRYVSSSKVGHIKSSGRTWLSAEDVRRLMSAEPSHQDTYNQYVSWRETRAPKPETFDSSLSQDETRHEETQASYTEPQAFKSSSTYSDINSKSYKELYYETKIEIEDKEGLLDQFRQKILQLETTIKQMVPLLELQKQKKMLSQNNQRYADHIHKLEGIYKKKAADLKHEICIKDHEIEVERFNKAIFAVILFLVLLLQPIFWFLSN